MRSWDSSRKVDAAKAEVSSPQIAACLLHFFFVQWRRRRDSNPRDPFGSNGFQDRRFQPLTHSSVSKYNLQQLLAGRLVTILASIAAFWCRVSPNCHQSLRVSRPQIVWNRDLYAY